jgi:hypothetical protein
MNKMQGSTDHNNIKKIIGGELLFYIEFSIFSQLVVYEAIRTKDVLTDPYVNLHWTSPDALHTRDTVGKNARDVFFGFKVNKHKVYNDITDKKKYHFVYQMLVAAMPDNLITIHLRKSGKCSAKATIDGKEARIIKIYVEMKGIIPTVECLHIYGVHKGVIVVDHIVVDSEMRKKFSHFVPSPF